ncbi:MAG TPA: hypothetical protein VFB84_20220 [Micromonosporaceae bacterium]|nr:hypothetical protein [Micromonosporaceae bacterium]
MRTLRQVAVRTLVALLCLGLAYGVSTFALARTTAPDDAVLALPDRVTAPWWWTPRVGQSPPGAVSLAFAGRSRALDTPAGDGNVAFVAGGRDTYRVAEFDRPYAVPGESLLLSPDGGRVAHTRSLEAARPGLSILDLHTGTARHLLTGDPQVYVDPLAWAPGGAALAVLRGRSGGTGEVGVVRLPGGEYRGLVGGLAVSQVPLYGFGVAFSPDGSRLAVERGPDVAVFRLADGALESAVRLPEGAHLAGKGAWTPDGRALALVAGAQGRWRVRLVDAATGADLRRALVEVPDAGALRLLGWRADGRALALAYRRVPGGPAQLGLARPGGATEYRHVRRVDLLALGFDGGPATVLAAPGGVLAMDVPDAVVRSGAARPGAGAPVWPVRPGFAVGVIAALALGAGLAGRWLAGRRRRAGRRPRAAGPRPRWRQDPPDPAGLPAWPTARRASGTTPISTG